MSYCIVCMDPAGGLAFCKPCGRAWDADARRDETMYAAVRWAARRARRMARRHQPKPRTCVWSLDPIDGYWRGSCGVEWVFEDGSVPIEHVMHYCPRCGAKLEQAKDTSREAAVAPAPSARGKENPDAT